MAISETLIMAAANTAPRWVERLVRFGACNPALLALANTATRRSLRRLRQLRRIGVVADTNIGDAVVLQGACTVFKRWLPHCQIDFFYQSKAEPLLRTHPFIDRHHPVFSDTNFTSSTNQEKVRAAILHGQYDLILNLYPFLTNSQLRHARCPVLVPYGLIAGIVQAERIPDAIAHVAHQLSRYVTHIARQLPTRVIPQEPPSAVAPLVHLASEVPARADFLLRSLGVPASARLAMINPDSSSRFSRIPLQIQSQLVRWLLESRAFDRVLIGPSYNFGDASEELYTSITQHPAAHNVIRLPTGIPIDTYAGLVDRSDWFLTSDTAQMHIAAAKRVASSGTSPFRNRTTLLTIFGATNSRIYGYDSFAPGYMDSLQNAPARVFQGTPHCRTLTCVHKIQKKCATVHCFDGLDLDAVKRWLFDTANSGNQHEGTTPRELIPIPAHFPGARQFPCLLTHPSRSTPNPIIVVSGLPRSGTSLMMQMLAAGGVDVATDGLRIPDEDNPHGYYELERARLLRHDASWLGACRGKAVKIVSPLLHSLPRHLHYKIIFMERNLAEVLASQKAMQKHRGTLDPEDNEEQLLSAFQQHLDSVKTSLAHQHNSDTLFVSYASTVASPLSTVLRLRRLLQRDLNTESMAAAVKKTLYRQRLS